MKRVATRGGTRRVLHPASQAVERYYTLFNEGDWAGLSAMFDKTVLTREAADRTPIKTWNCSYTLRLVGEDWLFTLITSDDTGTVEPGPASA